MNNVRQLFFVVYRQIRAALLYFYFRCDKMELVGMYFDKNTIHFPKKI